MDKPGGFIGREALLAPPARRAAGSSPSCSPIPEPLLYHGESVLQGGRVVGRVTSGAYGHTLGAAVGLAAINGPAGRGSTRSSPTAMSRSRSPASACRRG